MSPLTTDGLRRLAADWSLGTGEIRNALEAAADEVDRLRAALISIEQGCLGALTVENETEMRAIAGEERKALGT